VDQVETPEPAEHLAQAYEKVLIPSLYFLASRSPTSCVSQSQNTHPFLNVTNIIVRVVLREEILAYRIFSVCWLKKNIQKKPFAM
jgi:hypothetical protein